MRESVETGDYGLRRSLQDVVVLTSLPAVWAGCDPQGIAESLADVLQELLDLDLLYIRLKGPPGTAAIEVARSRRRPDLDRQPDQIGQALAPFLAPARSHPIASIPDPSGEGTVRILRLGFEPSGEGGELIAGSTAAEFPAESDPLLLRIGMNQAEMMIRQKRTEESLQASEQRFVRFMQHLPGLTWIKDALGRYAFVNDAAEKAFRTTRAELYGKTDDEVFPPETATQFKANDRLALASGAGIQTIEILEHDDGIPHHSIVSKFPIPGPDGQEVMVGGIAIDITDHLRAEQELREADRRKDEFLATLAHELRNPLAPLRSAVQVMRLTGGTSESTVRSLEVMERQLDQMVRLVDDLLELSRITRGTIELRRERTDLAAVVRNAIETSRPLIEAAGHNLTVTLASGPIPLEADPIRLAQVVANVLNNAAKYTDPGGQIRLTAGCEEDQAIIRVRDTGIGIPEAMLPRVFETFTQVDRSRRRSQGGLGIGLALVQSLVKLHGGSVAAHSDGPGTGSEFTIRLPLALATRPEGELLSNEDAPAVALPTRRILVVDDNHDAAESLAELLRLLGADVRAAYEGPAALQMIQGFRPAIVFLDIGMPGMDGYEVARRVRHQPEFATVVLIALTGWGQEQDRQTSRAAGIDHHLIKPVEFATLRALLASLGEGQA